MAFKKNEIEFESDKVKIYVQQIQAENGILKQECDKLKETFDGLFKVQYKLADNNKKLRQCLTEIKEIAEKLKNFYEELGKCEDLTVVRLKQILQKISEVENV